MASNYNSAAARPKCWWTAIGTPWSRAREQLRGSRAAGVARPGMEDGLMRVGLIVGHARSRARDRRARAPDAGRRASAWCCTPATTARRSRSRAVRGRASAARRRLRQKRRRHAGAARRGSEAASARSCSSRRTASRSAGERMLLVHDIGDVQRALASTRTRSSIHGSTHQQEMKTRGETLIVNPGEACGWLYGTPSAAILDLDTLQGRVPHARRGRVEADVLA